MSFLAATLCFRFRSIAPTTIRKADGVIIMYDVTCESSFNSVGQWIGDVQVIEYRKDAYLALPLSRDKELMLW